MCWTVQQPRVIIDMATLTGAQGVATGARHGALYCNSDALEKAAQASHFKQFKLHLTEVSLSYRWFIRTTNAFSNRHRFQCSIVQLHTFEMPLRCTARTQFSSHTNFLFQCL
jgi:Cytosol aminopeptidase family, catalytic domain